MLLCERRRTWTHFADMGMITEKELSDQLDEISNLPHSDSLLKQLMNLIRKESTDKRVKGEAEFIQTLPREKEEGETNALMKRKRTYSE